MGYYLLDVQVHAPQQTRGGSLLPLLGSRDGAQSIKLSGLCLSTQNHPSGPVVAFGLGSHMSQAGLKRMWSKDDFELVIAAVCYHVCLWPPFSHWRYYI